MAEENPVEDKRIQKPRGRPKSSNIISITPEQAAEVLTISKRQAKALRPKKQLSEKQAANCQRFADQQKAAAAERKAAREAAAKEAEEKARLVQVKVVPRKKAPPKVKEQPEEPAQEEPEEEPPRVQKKKPELAEVQAKVQAIKQIDQVLSQPANRYLALLQAKMRR